METPHMKPRLIVILFHIGMWTWTMRPLNLPLGDAMAPGRKAKPTADVVLFNYSLEHIV